MNLIDLLNTLVLALIMFSIGASLRIKDFIQVFKNPKGPVLGLVLQMVFLPLFTFCILLFSDLDPYLKVGVFIVSLCPGGTTSNFISYLVKADIALSIALTTLNSLIIMVTVPIFVNVGVHYFIGTTDGAYIPVGQTLLQVFTIIIIPVILGVWFNEKQRMLSKAIQEPLKYINVGLLALVYGVRAFAGKQSGGSGITLDDILLILPVALLVHLGSMITSYFISRAFQFNVAKSVTIGIEVGLQNTALALLVAGTMVGNSEMTKPALVFGIFTFFTTLAFGWIGMRKSRLAHLS